MGSHWRKGVQYWPLCLTNFGDSFAWKWREYHWAPGSNLNICQEPRPKESEASGSQWIELWRKHMPLEKNAVFFRRAVFSYSELHDSW